MGLAERASCDAPSAVWATPRFDRRPNAWGTMRGLDSRRLYFPAQVAFSIGVIEQLREPRRGGRDDRVPLAPCILVELVGALSRAQRSLAGTGELSRAEATEGGSMRATITSIVLLTAVLAAPVAVAQATVPLTTVLSLDASANEYPEGIAIDKRGNVYVGIAFAGRILKLAPDGSRSTLATLPVGGGILVGLAVDARGNVYAALASFDAATHGVWRISPKGTSERIAALDPTGFPNGLAFDDRGNLFVSDSFLATVWQIGKHGGPVKAWLQSPLLAGDPVNGAGFGANGLAFWRGDLYVSNTDQGSIVRVPVNRDGSAATPTIRFADAAIHFADGIAFDRRGNLYVASSGATNTLVRIAPDGTLETLATAADGLDYTASVAFGTGRGDRTQLYMTNAGINFGRPSIMKADVGVPGVPLPSASFPGEPEESDESGE
jgi:sugar lactone lactonase YvrE